MKKSRFLAYIILFSFLCFIVIRANKTENLLGKILPKKVSTEMSVGIKDIEVPTETKTRLDKKTKSYKAKKSDLPDKIFATYTVTTENGSEVKKIYKIRKGNKYQLINENHQQLTLAVYDDFSIFDFEKGLYLSYRNNKKGLVNFKGRMLIPAKYEKIEKTIQDDYVLVKNHKYTGLYDLDRAKLVVPPIYTNIISLDKYNWKLVSNQKFGFLNSKNKNIILIKPKYDSLEPYKMVYAISQNNKLGLIDAKSGDVISEPFYQEIELINEQNCERDNILIFKTKIENRYGVIFYAKDSLVSISPIYDDVQYKGLVNVYSNGYWRILDNKGNVTTRIKGASK